jgi:hypothetical protein
MRGQGSLKKIGWRQSNGCWCKLPLNKDPLDINNWVPHAYGYRSSDERIVDFDTHSRRLPKK